MDQDRAAILVKKASLEFDKMSNAALEKYGLTIFQYKVIKYLYEEADRGVRIVDLEKYYSLSHPTTIGIVQNLEKKGLVEYRENPNHARSRYIATTNKAEDLRDELEAVGASLEQEMAKNLTAEERVQLIDLLKKMMGLPEEEENL